MAQFHPSASGLIFWPLARQCQYVSFNPLFNPLLLCMLAECHAGVERNDMSTNVCTPPAWLTHWKTLKRIGSPV